MTPTEIAATIKGSWGVHGNVSYGFYHEDSNPQDSKIEGSFRGILRLLDDGKYKFTLSEISEDIKNYTHTSSYIPNIMYDNGKWEILKKDGESYLLFDNQRYYKINYLSKDGFKTSFSGEKTYYTVHSYDPLVTKEHIEKYSATMDSYSHE